VVFGRDMDGSALVVQDVRQAKEFRGGVGQTSRELGAKRLAALTPSPRRQPSRASLPSASEDPAAGLALLPSVARAPQLPPPPLTLTGRPTLREVSSLEHLDTSLFHGLLPVASGTAVQQLEGFFDSPTGPLRRASASVPALRPPAEIGGKRQLTEMSSAPVLRRAGASVPARWSSWEGSMGRDVQHRLYAEHRMLWHNGLAHR